MTLDWTAVGDDGRCGTATTYELRASSNPITTANFSSATPITIDPPAAAGTPESRTVTPPSGALFYALRAIDEVANAGPIAVVAQARPFTLRRLRLVVAGPGRDRLVLRGAMAQTLAQLGLPGQSAALALSDAGGEYFRATIPAAQILPSPGGTLVRFRDRTGTIANGITSFTMGGGGRNRVTIRAQHLDLTGASTGAFTATLDVGAAPFTASGVLRAAGSGFRFP